MNKYSFIIFIIFLNSFFFNNLKSNIGNKIILKVDNEIVTNFEVKNKILRTLIFSGEEINQLNIDSIKGSVLNNLIDLKLKKIQLEKLNFEIDNQSIFNYITSMSKKSISDLKIIFNNYNLDFDLLVEEIEIDLKWQQFILKNYANKIEIDENEITAEIEKIIQSKDKSKEVNLSEIEFFKKENSNDMYIEKIFKEINQNGFETAALKFSVSNTSSQKGLLGWMNTSVLSENIINELKNLKVGEISKPIIQKDSILILKLNSERFVNRNNINKKNLKKNLINKRQNEMFNLFSRSHLSKLKNNYLIEYK